jgi:hypothetical protein
MRRLTLLLFVVLNLVLIGMAARESATAELTLPPAADASKTEGSESS